MNAPNSMDITNPMMAEAQPYGSSLEHIADELRRIQLILDREIQFLRHRGTINDDSDFQGMFLQEAEIDKYLSEDVVQESPFLSKAVEADRNISKIRRRIRTRLDATRNRRGDILSLPRFCKAFSLESFEMDTILLCLAPELELKFQKLYAYVQNDFTRKRPTIDLIIRILRSSFRERIGARAYFAPEAPLVRLGLVTLDPPMRIAEVSLLSRELKLSDRVIAFLVDQDSLDPAVMETARLLKPQKRLEDLLIPDATKSNVLRVLMRAVETRGDLGWPVFLLQGPIGSGKKTLAEALAQKVNQPILFVDLETIPKERTPFTEAIGPAFREAGLQGAFLFFESYGTLHPPQEEGAPDYRSLVIHLHHAVNRYPGPVFLSSDTHEVRLHAVDQTKIFRVPFEIPKLGVREKLWRSFMPQGDTITPDVDALELASKFNLTGGQIQNAIAESGNLAMMRVEGDPRINRQDLFTGCRAQLTHQLASLADRVRKSLDWEDLILPKETLDHLREIAKYFKQRNFVFDVWGFDKKLPHGRGLSCLFSGPPGTGKTMVAGIIAAELEMDIYKIDLSRVVSKYVGETEKNLAKVFNEAKESHSILLFDEADSLFSKRTEVKSSVDRYANLEVNYLLQKIESFEGISILTTNFEKSIDEAFKRRLNFRIHFPFPDKESRTHLWQALLPKETPLSDEIDFEWLADKYELSGGNIKNAVLRAAFIAAERGTWVDHDCLEGAADREYHEIGKLVRQEMD